MRATDLEQIQAAIEEFRAKLHALSASDVLRTLRHTIDNDVSRNKEDLTSPITIAVEWILTKMIEKGY